MPNTKPYNKEEVMKEFEEDYNIFVKDVREYGEFHETLATHVEGFFTKFLSTALTAAEQAGEERMYRAGGEACKKVYQNHKEDHLCRFNDGEQNCDCYLSGINEVIVALEALK